MAKAPRPEFLNPFERFVAAILSVPKSDESSPSEKRGTGRSDRGGGSDQAKSS